MIRKLDEVVLDSLLAASAEDEVIDLVLAAMGGDSAVDALLAGQPAPPRPDPTAERVSPRGSFLTQLTVRGFRGIGPKTVLNLPAGPGLIVIAGRNGSGKSSLSEALECALTGTTVRWERKLGHAEFRTGWRNLHDGESCEITLNLTQVGQGEAAVRVAWPKEATDPGSAVMHYQVAGQKREQTDLGWHAAIQSYRPLLSYDDLGLLLTAKPSELHDSIARALALDELDDAVELLRGRIAPLKAPLRRAGDTRKQLRAELGDVDEDRAREAATLLGKTTPNLVRLNALASGPLTPDGPLQTCQRVRAVDIPAAEEVEAAIAELQAARSLVASIGEQRSSAEVLRDRLLAEALEYHGAAGDSTCPVCETGTLDADWRARTQAALQENDLLRTARNDAERRTRHAEEALRRLAVTPPAVLNQTDVDLAGQQRVVNAWTAWGQLAASTSDQLRSSFRELSEALADWQAEAGAYESRVTEAWTPYALRITRLVEDLEEAQKLAAKAAVLEAAYEAALKTDQQLRAERLNPIVDQTKKIWDQLRQESNVSLEAIELTGKGNRRAVDIKAVVDDAAGSSALSVMSQGELNSLALALYLPRATSDESPFRFLVLDDPVQAMDPTKVDGLATVLAKLAKTRQVIVFSHDDRLAQAARRLSTTPTILSVRRGSQSEVIVSNDLRPAYRHLNDAHAILREVKMDEDVKRRILPGVLRQAVEDAVWQRFSQERLLAGETLDDLERHWDEAGRVRARLELLVGVPLQPWLNRDRRRDRALRVCNSGTHQPTVEDLDEAVADTTALVQAVDAWAR